MPWGTCSTTISETQGPIYSTKPVTGEHFLGIDVTGPLNPPCSGSIQAPGARNPYEMPTSDIQYTLVEILVEEGSTVEMGQVIAKLAAPELQTQLKRAEDELKSERKFHLI